MSEPTNSQPAINPVQIDSAPRVEPGGEPETDGMTDTAWLRSFADCFAQVHRASSDCSYHRESESRERAVERLGRIASRLATAEGELKRVAVELGHPDGWLCAAQLTRAALMHLEELEASRARAEQALEAIEAHASEVFDDDPLAALARITDLVRAALRAPDEPPERAP